MYTFTISYDFIADYLRVFGCIACIILFFVHYNARKDSTRKWLWTSTMIFQVLTIIGLLFYFGKLSVLSLLLCIITELAIAVYFEVKVWVFKPFFLNSFFCKQPYTKPLSSDGSESSTLRKGLINKKSLL